MLYSARAGDLVVHIHPGGYPIAAMVECGPEDSRTAFVAVEEGGTVADVPMGGVRKDRSGKPRSKWAPSVRTPGACSTCTATSGNGAGTGCGRTRRRRSATRWAALLRVGCAWCAVVAGTTTPGLAETLRWRLLRRKVSAGSLRRQSAGATAERRSYSVPPKFTHNMEAVGMEAVPPEGSYRFTGSALGREGISMGMVS